MTLDHSDYVERGAAALDMELANLQVSYVLSRPLEFRMLYYRRVAEAVLEASGALDAVHRLEELEK